MPKYGQVAIVGVGLMGGSIGLSLRQQGLADEVLGVGRSAETLERALAVGAITRAETQLERAVADADVVIVATPVAVLASNVCTAVEAAPPGSLVTDVGSTKQLLCEQVDAHFGGPSRFVGSHPLAGDHRTGPKNARADLLEGRKVVITPTAATPPELPQRAREFWQMLGAEVVEMSPMAHDEALAATSHLPHLVASALAAITPMDALPLAATGWADTTRVAAGDPELWIQIFSQNAPAVRHELERLLRQLEELNNYLAGEDWTRAREFLQHAKKIRDALGN